jgi:hypothetical protein
VVLGLAWLAAAQGSAAGPCRFAVGEKLGVAFFHVCPNDPHTPPFWISAPLPCGQGEHSEVACPQATPLLRSRGTDDVTLRAGPVAMLDSFTAHRICGMRFAGTLPSREQRRMARDQLGLVTLLATQGPGERAELGLTELPEWAIDGACDNPSLPGAACHITPFPPAPLPLPLAWDGLRSCDARPVASTAADRASVEIGDRCGAKAPAWQSQGKGVTAAPGSCLVRDPGELRGSYALSCKKPLASVHPVRPKEAVAAVRCVVQSWALGQTNRGPEAK